MQPTRAIPEVNVPGAIAFATEPRRWQEVPVRLWVTGPAEDGYDDVFTCLVRESPVPVHVGRRRRQPACGR